MKLVEDSVINLNLSIRSADALRAYMVLGRSNGHVPGFDTSLYNKLAESLDVDSHHQRGMLHELGRAELGTINYISIQSEVETLFFGDNAKRNELAEKVAELKKIQDEVDALKLELGEV
jgi:hypothetical protein